MPIDARAFVEPSVAKAGIDARDNIVLRAISEKIRQVEAEGRVAIVVAADEATVDEHNHVAKRAVELDCNAPSRVAGGNLELAPVPAHAALRIPPAQRLESVRSLLSIVNERQLHRPVVWQIERAPLRVVELGLGKVEVACLGEVALSVAEAKVLCWIDTVPELKLPPKIKKQLFTRRYGCKRLGRYRARIA